MTKLRCAILFVGLFAFLAGASAPVQSQQVVRGQIFLPGGDLPRNPIKIALENAQGLHDYVFSDSQGKFVLEGLPANSPTILTVDSDGSTWADTRLEVTPATTQLVHLTLNAYVGKKGGKAPAPSGYTPDPELVDLHDRGVKAFEAGKPEEAERLLRKATDADHKYAIAFNDFGVILMRQRKYAEAETIFRKGLEASPKSISLLVNLGTDLIHAGKYSDSIPILREALRLHPEQAEAELQLGAALVETDQLAEAEQSLLTFEKEKGPDDAGLQLYLGKLYSRTGDYAKAINAFNAYLKLAPADSPNAPAIHTAIQQMQQQLDKH